MKRWNCPAFELSSLVPCLPAAIAILIGWIVLTPWIGRAAVQAVSVRGSLPVPVAGNGYSAAPWLSADGRFVVFTSCASDLVAGDNGRLSVDVFLRDCVNNTTTLVSVNVDGLGGGDENSTYGMASTNGQYVVFQSEASDLVSGDANDEDDIFVRDLVSSITRLVSVAAGGGPANGDSSDAVITPDGRYVVFVSGATNLVANDTNNIRDVFVRDLVAETTVRASEGASGPASTFMSTPWITPDGRFVVFASNARNLSPDVPTNASGEIYVRDLVAGSTIWASTNAALMASNTFNIPNLPSSHPSISDDGRYVAFKTGKSNGVGAAVVFRYDSISGSTAVVETNNFPAWTYNDDVYGPEMTSDGRFIAFVSREPGSNTNSCSVRLWDDQTGTNILVSADLGGNVPTNAISHTPVISANGQLVLFASNATNLTANVVSNGFHLYQRDLQSGVTQLIDVDTNGIGSTDLHVENPAMSSDGRWIAFSAPDGKLVAGDDNRDFDVFLRDSVNATTELASHRDPSLIPVTGSGISSLTQSSISADGRWLAFSSYSDDLVPNDTNRVQDVFVRDLLTGTNILVSAGTNGWPARGAFSRDPVISANGRFVAFASTASNLVATPLNRFSGIFRRDLLTGTTIMVSVSASGTAAPSADCLAPVISQDGNFITYLSRGTTPGTGAVRRNISAGTNLFLASSSTGINPGMSQDGRLIVYFSSSQIRVWDAVGGTNLYASPSTVTSMSLSPAGNALAYQIGTNLTIVDLTWKTNLGTFPIRTPLRSSTQWSTNGRFFAFVSFAPLTVSPTDSNGTNDVFLFDLLTGNLTLVSVNITHDLSASGRSEWPAVSGDGRFVIYRSFATNLVAGPPLAGPNIYVFDRWTGSNTLVSATGPMPDWTSWVSKPAISLKGEKVLFESWSSSLVQNDWNQLRDIFVDGFEVAVDSNGDGISDSWMTQYFGHPTGQEGDQSRPQDDADGDGVTNLQEYLAGTNPVDAASVLRVAIVVTDVLGNALLKWPVTPGRSYRVQSKTQLDDSVWADFPGAIVISGSEASMLVPTPEITRFYRVIGFY